MQIISKKSGKTGTVIETREIDGKSVHIVRFDGCKNSVAVSAVNCEVVREADRVVEADKMIEAIDCPYCKDGSCTVCEFEREWINVPKPTIETRIINEIDRVITEEAKKIMIEAGTIAVEERCCRCNDPLPDETFIHPDYPDSVFCHECLPELSEEFEADVPKKQVTPGNPIAAYGISTDRINGMIRKHTAFSNLPQMYWDVQTFYSPSLNVTHEKYGDELTHIADAYDTMMQRFGDKRRAYRY